MSSPSSNEERTSALRLRGVSFALAFAAFALATPMLIFEALDRLDVAEVEIGMDVINDVHERLPALSQPRAQSAWKVGFLGDSMVISYPPGRTVPEQLARSANVGAAPRHAIEVVSLAAPGMGPFDYYFIADEVANAAPDQVILPFNLASLSNGWRQTFSRPELAGWLAPARLPGALRLPLEWIGLTTDRMLLYVALVRAGAHPIWQALVRQQARLGPARTTFAAKLEKRFGQIALLSFGSARFRNSDAKYIVLSNDRKRLSALGLRQRFGRALDGVDADAPSLRVLVAAITRFREDGIRVLVYVNPTNTTNMREANVLDEPGMSKTLDVIAAAVRAAGGEFADFHTLLPNEAFRDAAGHFNVREGSPDGPRLLGEALAPLVLEEARAFGRSPGRSPGQSRARGGR